MFDTCSHKGFSVKSLNHMCVSITEEMLLPEIQSSSVCYVSRCVTIHIGARQEESFVACRHEYER